MGTRGTSAQQYIEPDLVQRATLGAPKGAAPMAAVNSARSRQAPFELPKALELAWRARVTPPVGFEPVVDASGRIVVVHERGTVSQLDKGGKSQWSLRLGDAAPSAGPALLSDGSRAILNHDNALVRISPTGVLLGETALGLSGNVSPLLPLTDGGLAVSVGARLVWLDHQGSVIGTALAPSDVLALIRSHAGVLAVCRSGQVYRFHATGTLSEAGSFPSKLRNIALAHNTLYAITADEQLLALDLRTKRVRVVFGASATTPILPSFALGPKAVHLATQDGLVRALSASGEELWRAVLTGQNQNAPGLESVLGARLLTLAGLGSRIAVAQAGSELMLVNNDGGYQRVKAAACLSPTALTPHSAGHILLTCRSGELMLLESRPPGP